FARFGLSVDGRAADLDARWILDTEAGRDELNVTTGRLDLAVGDGRISFDALRATVDQRSTARVDGEHGIARGGGAQLDLGTVAVDAELATDEAPSTATITSSAWSASVWRTASDGFTGSIDTLRLGRLTPPAGLPTLGGAADVRIDAAIDPPRITVDARPTHIRLPDAEPIELTPSEPPTTATVDARLTDDGEVVLERLRWQTDLALWRRLVDDRLPEPVRPFSLGGRASGDWRLDGERFTGPLRVDRVGTVSDDGARVVDGLAGSWRVDGRWLQDPPTIEARLSGRHGGFQLLWNTVYADFSTAGAVLDLDVAWRGETWSTAIDWRPDGGPTTTIELTVDPAIDSTDGVAPRYALRVVDADLATTFNTYLEPLTAEVTALDDLAGQRRLHRGGELGATPTARGRLELTDARVATSDSAIDGLHLDVPVDARSAAEGVVGPRLDGRLAFSSATTRGFTLPAIVSRVQIEGDDIGLVESLRLGVLGGELVLDRATLRDLLGAPIAETGLRLDGLDLGRLAADLGLPTVEGRLDGHLPRVRVIGDELRVDGGGTIRAFGGEIALFDLAGREIFSDFPELSFSAEIDDLDLGQLTRRFDVGEMTGILDGRIDECRLFRGMPTAFRARFESVERSGVEQTVDVKAVRNLTILGTGADPGALDRGLTRLLSRFRYSELGVEVSLDRDILLLRGLIQRDDKELFLAGRFPFGIDVVNARPGQTVSFQTMVRRLQALDTSRVRSE
ncbi:MAG: hypothetical protein AAGE94_19710, partial [Acidobacteriota bacterium]